MYRIYGIHRIHGRGSVFKPTICPTETVFCVRIMIRLPPLSPDIVHDLVFSLPGDVGVRQDHLNVLPAWVVVQPVMNVEPQTVGQPKHKWCALQNKWNLNGLWLKTKNNNLTCLNSQHCFNNHIDELCDGAL